MKRLLIITLTAIMLAVNPVSAFAYNYSFESGADSKETFGKSTPTDEPAHNPELENVRRNKDAAFKPPSYGIFSGEIPTDPSSLYHDNSRQGAASNVTNYSTAFANGNDIIMVGNSGAGLPSENASNSGGFLVSTSAMPDSINTLPLYNNDGSIGTLSIPKLKLNVKVFEGETLDNMKVGIGHFEFTSVWDGNVGLAAHNRGSSGYFQGVKDLKNGDIMTFETKYGTRKYEVFYKEQISDTDYSNLGWTQENMLTLITCVEDKPTLRWCVQAREIL